MCDLYMLMTKLTLARVRMSPLTPQDEEPRLGLRVHPGRRFRAEQQQHDGADALQYELSRCTTLPLPEDRLYYSQPADTVSKAISIPCIEKAADPYKTGICWRYCIVVAIKRMSDDGKQRARFSHFFTTASQTR